LSSFDFYAGVGRWRFASLYNYVDEKKKSQGGYALAPRERGHVRVPEWDLSDDEDDKPPPPRARRNSESTFLYLYSPSVDAKVEWYYGNGISDPLVDLRLILLPWSDPCLAS
jgi:hypothetical protein